MDAESIVDVPSDNPEMYCRLCFSGFNVEPVFPPEAPPKQTLIDMVGQHIDIHITAETDFPCAVCRMCQMTLGSFHQYRERCRRLDTVLQRRRAELAEVRVKVEPEESAGKARGKAPGFEQDTVYCLSDSDEEEDEEDDHEDAPMGSGEDNDADEEDLIRGDILIKSEPVDGDTDSSQQGMAKPAVPRKIEPYDKDEVVVLDSDDDDDGTRDGDQSMAAPSTRASSEAPTEENNSPEKELPMEVTEDGGYRCTICQEVFARMNEIKVHIRKAHPREAAVYSCQYCSKKFSNKTAMASHSRYHTMDFPFSCDECGAKFTVKQRLDRHVSKYHDKNSPNYTEQRFQCELCPRIFLSVQARIVHLNNFHAEKSKETQTAIDRLPSHCVHFCTPCNAFYDTPEQAKAHVAESHPPEHTLEKRIKCPECGKLFRFRNSFKYHMASHHGTMPHVCDICGSGFERLGKLKRHKEKKHGEDAPKKALERYKCDQCERFFLRNQDRMRHEQVIHHIETPAKLPKVFEGRKNNFPCSKCDKRFISLRTMRIHFSLKHPDVAVRFKCTICSKRFRQQEALRDHMASHSGEHPYACEQCDDRFTSKEDQEAHIRELHEQNSDDDAEEGRRRRFKCFYCPRKLLTASARAHHVRHVHPGKDTAGSIASQVLKSLPKSLVCTYCEKVFNNRNTLKLHVLNHLGKLPHQCDQCDAGFYKPSNLENHKQRYHSEGNALSLASRFKCAYCPRVFVRRSARLYHHNVFHGVKRSMEGAAASSASSNAIRRPRVKLDPDFRYPCALCSLVFVTPEMVQEHHQQQHPDQEFFFKCPQCPKRSTHRKGFITHIKMAHMGGHPHPCDECTASFHNPGGLANHKKRYHGDQAQPLSSMFKCTMCNRYFARNQDRVRHQVQMHNYRVGTSANPKPGPSSGRSILKIKQERMEPTPPAAVPEDQPQMEVEEPLQEEAKSKGEEGFSVTSDIEDNGELYEVEMPPVATEETTVPTITSVVSIKEEVIGARMLDQSEF